jgi:toxin ParE1/3/4
MSRNIFRRAQAIVDLAAIVDEIARDRPRTAERFLKAANEAVELLATMPEAGGLCEFCSPLVQDMRVWPIRKFKKYLIFYRPIENGIEVIRVLYGGRDLESLFG